MNREYLKSLKPLLILSSFLFLLSFLYGYFSADEIIKEGNVIEGLQEMFAVFFEAGPFKQFLFIFLGNSLTVFLTITFGIAFGIFPLIVLFANGTLLGIFAFLFKDDISFFLLGILPHGIIEIPVLIVSAAIGLKIGRVCLKKEELKRELFSAFNFWGKILLPLTALAALIEVFITARILL